MIAAATLAEIAGRLETAPWGARSGLVEQEAAKQRVSEEVEGHDG